MEYLLSVIYSIIDSICVLIFLSTFSSFRFAKTKQYLLSGLYIASVCLIVFFNMVFFEYDDTIKVLLVIICNILYGRILYVNVSTLYLAFLVVLEYLLTYLLSFINLYISSIICGVSIQAFRQDKVVPFIVSSAIYYFLEVVFVLLIRKFVQERNKLKNNLKHSSILIMLYLMFPSASFVMLLVLLRITSKQGLSERLAIGCCWMIFIANTMLLYLLEQVEQERQSREKLLALNQQLQIQRKNIEETCNLYSAQRKQVHDFRAHLAVLTQLIENQEFDTAKEYLDSILKQQNNRIFLVDCHHSVLNALFNSKISDAIKNNIDIHFEVNDLSELSLDAIDLTVLLSNLIDNAIEGCERCPSYREIQIRAFIERGCFHFIIRNTSLPVTILNGEIPSTKADPHLHGYGLANIKAILKKYNAEYTMFYHNGYFQFVFELLLSA